MRKINRIITSENTGKHDSHQVCVKDLFVCTIKYFSFSYKDKSKVESRGAAFSGEVP
jgi:hypothetical protein